MLLLGGVRIELSREQPIFKMGNWLVSHNLEVPPASTKLSQLQDEIIHGQGGALGGNEEI